MILCKAMWVKLTNNPDKGFHVNTNFQTNNHSYNWLWWLNGTSEPWYKAAITVISYPPVPNAQDEMYASLGAEKQRIYVIPSKKMVMIRMGVTSDPANPSFAVSGFDNEVWGKLNAVIYQAEVISWNLLTMPESGVFV